MMIDEQPRINRLLLFNLATDADDVALGFAISWITELSKHVKAIDVITMRVGRYALPENVCVYSVGKEKGYSEPRRFIEFYRIFFRLLRKNRYDGCFAHMMQLFAVMAAPFLRWKNIPLILWYAHKSVTPTLRLATFFADRIVTASPESFRIASPKVRVIGHGIDTTRFAPRSAERAPSDRFTIMTVGRISRIKRLELLIAAVAIVKQRHPEWPLRVLIVGGTATADDEQYFGKLRQQIEETDVQNIVQFVGSVPFEAIETWYQQADCFVNLCPTGGMDKAVLEAMSCGVIIIAANYTFYEVVGDGAAQTMIIQPDKEQLAERLIDFIMMPCEQRQQIGLQLRKRIMQYHNIAQLCEKLFYEFYTLIRRDYSHSNSLV